MAGSTGSFALMSGNTTCFGLDHLRSRGNIVARLRRFIFSNVLTTSCFKWLHHVDKFQDAGLTS